MKGGLDFFVFVLASVVIGIIILTIFPRIYAEVFLTPCFKNGLKEARNLLDAAEKGNEYTLTVNGECVKEIVITGIGGRDECANLCAEIFVGSVWASAKNKCIENCAKCKGPQVKGQVLVVPDTSGFWSYFKESKDTFQERWLHSVFCYSTGTEIIGTTSFPGEKGKMKLYCVTFRGEDAVSVSSRDGRC